MLKFLALGVSLCRQDLQERFAGSLLGVVWVFIWPLVQLFIYIVIFGRVMGARLGVDGQSHSYGLYVASGLLCWPCFANTLQGCAHALIRKKHIISKVNVDLRVFPLAVCFGEMLPFFAGLFLLCGVDIFLGWRPETKWFFPCLLALWCQQALAIGLGTFFACCAVFARDVLEVTGIALQMGFWFTPIVYLPSILPAWLAKWLWLNPMACVVEVFQKSFVMGGQANIWHILYLFIISHLALALGLYVLHAWQKDIRDVL